MARKDEQVSLEHSPILIMKIQNIKYLQNRYEVLINYSRMN